jgi:hypothetical protein
VLPLGGSIYSRGWQLFPRQHSSHQIFSLHHDWIFLGAAPVVPIQRFLTGVRRRDRGCTDGPVTTPLRPLVQPVVCTALSVGSSRQCWLLHGRHSWPSCDPESPLTHWIYAVLIPIGLCFSLLLLLLLFHLSTASFSTRRCTKSSYLSTYILHIVFLEYLLPLRRHPFFSFLVCLCHDSPPLLIGLYYYYFLLAKFSL